MNERDLSDAALRSTGEGFSRFVPFGGGMSQKYSERNNCRAWDLPISLSWRADEHNNISYHGENHKYEQDETCLHLL